MSESDPPATSKTSEASPSRRGMNGSEQLFVLRERVGGHFQRTVELPGDVDYEASSANLREGLLILHLPKA